MARIKRSVNALKKRRKVMKLAKGYWGAKSKQYRAASEQVARSLRYAFKGRKLRKRDFRSLWITRINAAARLNGHELFHVHQWPEEAQHHRQPQDSCGSGCERCSCFHQARGNRQGVIVAQAFHSTNSSDVETVFQRRTFFCPFFGAGYSQIQW